MNAQALQEQTDNAKGQHRIQIPYWARPLEKPAFYKSIRGGRGSTKTWTVARLLLLRSMIEPVRIHCCREIQNSIEDSNFKVLKDQIHLLGLSDYFDTQSTRILGHNGSEFVFWGLEKRRASIRGWENVRYCWIEQAERMSKETWEVLEPTMSRNDGSEIWLTWNPVYRTDMVWQRFMEHPEPGEISLSVNYTDLPPGFFAKNFYVRAERVRDENPDTYAQMYLGIPDDGSADVKILTYAMVKECIDAYRDGLAPEPTGLTQSDVGFDIADGGADLCAAVPRRGPRIEHVEAWPSQTPGFLGPSAARAHALAKEHDAWRLYFDATGVGSPMRGELFRLKPKYRVIPVTFGGAPAGPDRMYERGVTNKQMFSKRNIQMGFAVRARARNTLRLKKGVSVDPNDCLFINPRIPRITEYIRQLTQPVYRQSPTSGRLEMDKREGREKSPDKYDGTVMAFARDSENGLTAVNG